MLQAQSVTKKWKNHQRNVIDTFSFNFLKSHHYQLVGENGRGKTTLLKILAGLLVPDDGQVICHHKLSWCGSFGCGVTPRLTGRENIKLMATFLGLNEKKSFQRLSHWQECFGFADALDTVIGHCSHGMKAMISLYISQINDANIILWDEPFAHLSLDNTKIMLERWQELTDCDVLIFSSHEQLSAFKGEVITL